MVELNNPKAGCLKEKKKKGKHLAKLIKKKSKKAKHTSGNNLDSLRTYAKSALKRYRKFKQIDYRKRKYKELSHTKSTRCFA